MGIRVKHAPSAAALGETAYTIGRGQRRERDIRFAADVALRQRSLDLQKASLQLQSLRSRGQLGLQGAALAFRKEEAVKGREAAEREFSFRKEQWEDEPSRQLEKGLQQQELLQSKITWQYDEGQKRELAKITTGVAWLRTQVAAGKWTAEQAEQAEQQLWRKYYSIIPLPVYDDKATPQEIYNSNVVTDSITGAQYRMNERGGFEPVGIGFKDYAKLRADVAKSFTMMDAEGNVKIDWDATDKFVDETMVRYTKIQGFAARAEEEQKRRAQRGPQPSLEQEAKTKAVVEALPTLFSTLIKGQPKIGRKKKGETSKDKVYGEEAYNKTLIEAVGRLEQEGISPDVVKAELDKWWDAQYDKERGQMFQKFGDRLKFEGAFRKLEFEGAARKKAPEKRKVAPEVNMDQLDKLSLQRVKKFKSSGKIAWVEIRKKFGRETADELKYICDSGNEQAIANALRRLGII